MSLISVIIPAYNAERTIALTIASVQSQTCQDFELIVVNDGSTDGTQEILATIQDPRLKILTVENGGVSKARNFGIANSSGKFLTFIDADDLWTKEKLASQVAALKKSPEVGVVYSWTLTMSEDGKQFHPGKFSSFEGNVYPKLLLGNFIASGSNLMVRREAADSVEGFDPTLTGAEDWDYCLRLAEKWPFAVVKKPQVLYRQSDSSASSQIKTMESDHFIVHDKAFRNTPSNLQALEPKSRANYYHYLAGLSLSRVRDWNDITFAFHRLGLAVRAYPKTLLGKRLYILAIKIVFLVTLTPTFGKKTLSFLSTMKSSQSVEAFSANEAWALME